MTEPWNHRVTSHRPALFASAATISSAESSESTVSVRPSSAKDRLLRILVVPGRGPTRGDGADERDHDDPGDGDGTRARNGDGP